MGEMADWINQDDPEEDRDQWIDKRETYLGVGRTGDCDCADDYTCAEHRGFYLCETQRKETMTDRFKGLIVALDKDYRDDDAASIIEAIKMVKGVLEVKPVVAKIDDCVIKIRVAEEMEKKLYKALHSYEDE
jgi:hypothetical protein